MWNDVVDLRDFYDDRLGRTARRMIARRIRTFWPDVSGRSLLGLGYASPYIGQFRGEAERVMAVMPPVQGVLHWPPDEAQQVCLADECHLPFPDLSIDLILVVHGMECAESLRPMMREIWRVLSAAGRLLVVAPNRRGLWCRLERTPFGTGRPYSGGQLKRTLRECLFTPLKTDHALFVPPTRSRLILGAAPAWEGFGHRWMSGAAGVLVCEATKEIYAGAVAEGSRVRTQDLAKATPSLSGSPQRAERKSP